MSKTKLKKLQKLEVRLLPYQLVPLFFAVIVWRLHLLLVWLRPGGEAKEAAAS